MEVRAGTERPEHRVDRLVFVDVTEDGRSGSGMRELSQVPKSPLTVEAWQEVRGCQRLRGQRGCGQGASQVQGFARGAREGGASAAALGTRQLGSRGRGHSGNKPSTCSQCLWRQQEKEGRQAGGSSFPASEGH